MSGSFSPTRVLALWGRLNSSFWFVPAVMALAAIALSFVLIEVDALRNVPQTENPGAIYRYGAEGARAVLSVIASSMITVASLIFSITMLSLQLASSQFGPRTVSNFMRNRSNQIVLGTFIATFLYCLLVLRSVRVIEDSSFVPHISVGFGILLAAASVAVLIYFIHHIATSIRVETLLEELTIEGCRTVDRVFPERSGDHRTKPEGHFPDVRLPDGFDEGSAQIAADSDGYVQTISIDVLTRIAIRNDLTLKFEVRPGTFVTEGVCLTLAYPKAGVTKKIEEDLRGGFVIGRDRTPDQDPEFAIRRIVELAQRSLSSGFNDPTTAIYCIDRLGQVLGRLAGRDISPPIRIDPGGQLRVWAETLDLGAVTCRSFAAIARYGTNDADVVTQLADTLAKLEAAFPPVARQAVSQLRLHVLSGGHAQAQRDFDREILLALQESHKAAR